MENSTNSQLHIVATATGMTDKTPQGARERLVVEVAKFTGKPVNELTVAFIRVAGDVVPQPKGPEDDKKDAVYHGDQAIRNFQAFGCTVTIIDSDTPNLQAMGIITFADLVYVEGGNASYLLWWLEQRNLKNFLKSVILNGKAYIGSSAGSMILGEHVHLSRFASLGNKSMKPFTPKSQRGRNVLKGLAIVNAIFWPHFNEEQEKDQHALSLASFLFFTRTIIPIPDGESIPLHALLK